MAYPAGVSLAVLTTGSASDFFGADAAITATVTPVLKGTSHIVHAATGAVMVPAPQVFSAEAGEGISFSVPHTDQDGWLDGAGNAYKGWYYKVALQIGRGRTSGPQWTKTVQPVLGQALIDLDLVADGQVGEPVAAPVATVTSVEGQTGAVVLGPIVGSAIDQAVAEGRIPHPIVSESAPGVYEIGEGGTVYGLTPNGDLPQSAIDGLDNRFASLDSEGRQPVRKGELIANVRDFGAKGDGTTDDYAAISAGLDSGSVLFFPRGDYLIRTQIKRSFSGARLVGQDGARIFSDTVAHLVRFDATDGARFEGLTFETLATAGINTSYGVVCSLNVSMKNIRFVNCEFSAPNAGSNGLKIVADNLTEEYAVDNVKAIGCRFVRCGRMGLEIQNHTATNLYLVRDVGATDCEFADNGAMDTGIDCSFSGRILAPAARGLKFRRSRRIALEFAGPVDSPLITDIEWYDASSTCWILSITNNQDTGEVPGARIARNRSIGRSGLGVQLRRLIDARMSENRYLVRNGVYFLDCERIESWGEEYNSDGGPYSCYVESSSTRYSRMNYWQDARLVTGSGAYATVRFYGANTVDNAVMDSTVSLQTGGAVDQLNGATRNRFVRVGIGSTTPWKPIKSVTISDADRSVNMTVSDADVLVFTGTATAPRTVSFAPQARSWTVKNNTTQGLNLGAEGATVTLDAGRAAVFALDGTTASLL